MRLPVLPRSAVTGAACVGTLCGVAGLVLALLAHPPTAWFAVFEVGIPAAMAGGMLGLELGRPCSVCDDWELRAGAGETCQLP